MELLGNDLWSHIFGFCCDIQSIHSVRLVCSGFLTCTETSHFKQHARSSSPDYYLWELSVGRRLAVCSSSPPAGVTLSFVKEQLQTLKDIIGIGISSGAFQAILDAAQRPALWRRCVSREESRQVFSFSDEWDDGAPFVLECEPVLGVIDYSAPQECSELITHDGFYRLVVVERQQRAADPAGPLRNALSRWLFLYSSEVTDEYDYDEVLDAREAVLLEVTAALQEDRALASRRDGAGFTPLLLLWDMVDGSLCSPATSQDQRVESKALEITRLLLAHGADIGAVTRAGQTLLDVYCANTEPKEPVVRALKSLGVKRSAAPEWSEGVQGTVESSLQALVQRLLVLAVACQEHRRDRVLATRDVRLSLRCMRFFRDGLAPLGPELPALTFAASVHNLARHKEVSLSTVCLRFLDLVARRLFAAIAHVARWLALGSPSRLLTAREIQTSARLVLPWSVAVSAVSSGTKAVVRSNSMDYPSIGEPLGMTRSQAAGVQFSIGLLHQLVLDGDYPQLSDGAISYLAGAMDSVIGDFLEPCEQQEGGAVLTVNDMLRAVADPELIHLCGPCFDDFPQSRASNDAKRARLL